MKEIKGGIPTLIIIALIMLSEQYKMHTLSMILFVLLTLSIVVPLISLFVTSKNKYTNRLIKKNRRRPCGQIQHPFFCIKKDKTIEKDFTFCADTIYHFDDDDNNDKNKLFGFSYGFTDGPLSFIKNDISFRFGWNCQNNNGMISIFTYTRDIDKMMIDHLFDVTLEKRYKYIISYVKDQITYTIKDGDVVVATKTQDVPNSWKWYGSSLGIYFGGQKKCPHDMNIIHHLD